MLNNCYQLKISPMNNTLNIIKKINSINYDGQTDGENGHSDLRKTGKNEYDIKVSKNHVNCPKKHFNTCLRIQSRYPRATPLGIYMRSHQNRSIYQTHEQMIDYCRSNQYPRASPLGTKIRVPSE